MWDALINVKYCCNPLFMCIMRHISVQFFKSWWLNHHHFKYHHTFLFYLKVLQVVCLNQSKTFLNDNTERMIWNISALSDWSTQPSCKSLNSNPTRLIIHHLQPTYITFSLRENWLNLAYCDRQQALFQGLNKWQIWNKTCFRLGVHAVESKLMSYLTLWRNVL